MPIYIELNPNKWTVFESNDPVLDEICGRTGLRTAYYKDTWISNIERVLVTFQTSDGTFVVPSSRRLRGKTDDELKSCIMRRSVTLDNAVEKLLEVLKCGVYLQDWNTLELCLYVPTFSCLDELRMKLDIAN